MKQSMYKQKRIVKLKKEACILYERGFSTREIAGLLSEKRSHAWVAQAIKEDVRNLVLDTTLQ